MEKSRELVKELNERDVVNRDDSIGANDIPTTFANVG